MCSRPVSFPRFLQINFFRSEAEVMEGYSNNATKHGQIADPLNRLLPQAHDPGNPRVFGQSPVSFRVGNVMKDIDNARAADARRIVNTRVDMAILFAKLGRPRF